MKRRLIVAAAVLAAAAILALVVWLARLNPWFHVAAPLATVLLVAGAVAACAILLIGYLRERRVAALARETELAREEQRTAHRRFLRRLDHEIKNPVTAIRSALAAAPSDPAALDVAGAQAARLSSLVTELAKLADLETRDIARMPVDLEEVSREAADAVQGLHPDRELRIEFPRVPWPVPPVAGDPDLLVVAVYNLAANAAKYSDPGARIEIRGSESDGFVSLEVADTGWGMPADDLASAWDELARGSNTRGREGSGLGLSIVRVIVQRHGGTVALQSAPGQGTRVVMRLPVALPR